MGLTNICGPVTSTKAIHKAMRGSPKGSKTGDNKMNNRNDLDCKLAQAQCVKDHHIEAFKREVEQAKGSRAPKKPNWGKQW